MAARTMVGRVVKPGRLLKKMQDHAGSAEGTKENPETERTMKSEAY